MAYNLMYKRSYYTSYSEDMLLMQNKSDVSLCF
jgi:hypothetical protein